LEFLNHIYEDVPLNVLCVKIITLFLAPESSKSIRTGIKSSALGCLTEMLKIDPNLAFIAYNSPGKKFLLLKDKFKCTNYYCTF